MCFRDALENRTHCGSPGWSAPSAKIALWRCNGANSRTRGKWGGALCVWVCLRTPKACANGNERRAGWWHASGMAESGHKQIALRQQTWKTNTHLRILCVRYSCSRSIARTHLCNMGWAIFRIINVECRLIGGRMHNTFIIVFSERKVVNYSFKV